MTNNMDLFQKASVPDGLASIELDPSFVLVPLHHTYLETLVVALDQGGFEGMFGIGEDEELAHQLISDRAPWDALETENCTLKSLDPTTDDTAAPADLFAFTVDAPQRIYNWELFVHAPLRIAQRLKESGEYNAALRWIGFVMVPALALQPYAAVPSGDPTMSEAWRPRPLWDPAPFTDAEKKQLAWTANPFDVHGIAEHDPQVYRFAVARQFVDTLIAWGDELFSRDTMESIAEATQIYLYALDFLGPRPVPVNKKTTRGTGFTFAQIRGGATSPDGLSNPLTDLENLLTDEVAGEPTIRLDTSSVEPGATVGYFCEPRNDHHLQLWTILEDRLFKIRHCMNIDGVVRTLAIFDPPLDPGALVAAAAAGRLSGAVQPTRWVSPHVRFAAMVGMAKSLAQSVQRLGSALQSALQSRDAEALSTLRQRHEVELLELADDLRRMQVEEARLNKGAVDLSRRLTDARRQHYASLIDEGPLKSEKDEEDKLDRAATLTNLAGVAQGTVSLLSQIPEFHFQGVASGASKGGQSLVTAAYAIGEGLSFEASRLNLKAADLNRKGTRIRRRQEWKLQMKLAERELVQIDAQLDAADKRIEIAERELETSRKQIEHSREIDRLLRSRFSNEELFGWMVGELSQLHSATYQLALEVSRKAEACFRRELAVPTSNYIGAGHWNASRKGLLAGDKLIAELERMEVAFVEQDRRELEITKHVSLKRLDPGALLALKAIGTCSFVVPEVLYDLDFPGHYLRRIKAVSVSIPAVSGPYEGLNATLALTSSEVRTDPAAAPYDTGRTPERWTERVVLSGGQQDGGLFNFDLRDPKYLPFEHRGAIGTWTLELAGTDPAPANRRPQFDWNSISDVVMHVRYTARHDPDLVADARGSVAAALEAVRAGMPPGPLQVGLSFREEAQDAWSAFLNQNVVTTNPVLSMSFDRSRLPYVLDALGPKVKGVTVVFWCADGLVPTGNVRIGIHTDGTVDLVPSVALAAGVGGVRASFDLSTTLPAPGAGQLLAVEITGLGEQVRAGNFVDPKKLLDIVVLLDLDFP